MTKDSTRWGTTGVLLADLIATIGAIAFAIAYTRDSPWTFAPLLCVTLFLSILIAILIRQSDKTLRTVNQSLLLAAEADLAIESNSVLIVGHERPYHLQ